MEAQKNVILENHVKLFVESKLGETVCLKFSTNIAYVKPQSKKGSTTLGSFWVRVIQEYFPSPQFTYNKGYSSAHGSETLTTVADNYTITIYLRSGLLTVEGRLAYEWFKVIFTKVIHHYDRKTHSTSKNYYNDQIVFDTRREIHKKERRLFEDAIRPPIVDANLALVSSDVSMPGLEERFGSVEDMEREIAQEQQQLVPFNGSPMHASTSSVTLRDGESYIYPMWKQLLNKWLGTDGCRLYMCAKHIDADRLKDLTVMAYKYRLYSGLEAIYTDSVSAKGGRMVEVKDSLLEGRTADEKLFIEYRILNKIKYGVTKSISCNFIAGLYENNIAEVMVTSATFDRDGFDRLGNLHTVVVTKMTAAEFKHNIIDKLDTV